MNATTCPSGESIRQFLLGELPEAQAESVAGHLGRCTSCAQTLNGLQLDDTLLATLRRASEKAIDVTPAPEVQQLIERFRKLAKAGDATAGEETLSPQQPVENPLDFLAPAQATDEIGRLGSYRVLRSLGAGGMGLVLLAEDTKLGRRVALKVMAPSVAASRTARDRFFREARHAASLKHDNVVTIYQVDEERGIPFLAMELLEGEPLDERLKREGRLPAADVLRIGREIAQGLAAAHKRGLLHRDIKPANIWLEGEPGASATGGRVKILDFGLARAVREEAQLTQLGMIVGTPAYMAPEQGRGGEVDHRADLFSLGCVLYRMATGQNPFRGTDVVSTLLSVATDAPAMPASFGVPAVLSDLIMKLLEKKPADRPESAAAVVLALAALETSPVAAPTSANPWADIDATESSAPAPPPRARSASKARPEPAPQAPKKRPRWPLAVAAALLVLALGGALAGYQLLFKTENGTLIVEVDGDADVRFKNGKLQIYDEEGELKYELQPSERNKSLPAGKYVAKVTGVDGLTLDTDKFEIKKAGKTIRVSVDQRVLAKRTGLSDDPDRRAAEWVLQNGGGLQVVWSEGDSQVVIKSVESLPAKRFYVHAIELSHKQIDDAGLAMVRGLTRLEVLDLSYTKVTDAGLEHLAGLSNLRGLNLSLLPITDRGLEHLKPLASLSSLILSGTLVTDHGLSQLSPQLVSLYVIDTKVTAESLKRFTKLEFLHLARMKFSDSQLNSLRNLEGLSFLDLTENPITSASVPVIKHFKKLTDLRIRGTKLSADEVAELHAELPACKIESDHGTFAPSDPDRRVAAWVLRTGGRVSVLVGNTAVNVPTPESLPAGAFRLQQVALGAGVSDDDLQNLEPVSGIAFDLSLNDCRAITDRGLERLAAIPGLRSLPRLALQGTRITDKGLRHLERFDQLKYLYLTSTAIGDAGLESLARLKSLEGLNIRSTQATEAGVKKLAAALPRCKIASDYNYSAPQADPDRRAAEWVLKAGGRCAILLGDKGALITTPAQFPTQPFELVGVGFDEKSTFAEADFERLRGLQKLGNIKLFRAPMTDAALKRLGDLPALYQLDLSYTRVTGAGLEHLAQFKKLIYLQLEGIAPGPVGLRNLRSLSELQRLNLSSVRMTDADVDAIASLSNLQDLSVNAQDLSNPDEALKKLAALHKLTHFQFVGPARVTEAGCAHVGKLISLNELNLTGTGVTDRALPSLASLPNLEVLLLRRCALTDAGVSQVRRFPHIKVLSLSGSRISDASLEFLKDLKQLTSLALDQTKVTAAGVKKLVAALPQCLIVSDHGTFEPRESADPDRRAAAWALSIGGKVGVDGQEKFIARIGDLPPTAFILTHVSLDGVQSVADRDLERFARLRGLTALALNDTPLTDAALSHLRGLMTMRQLGLNNYHGRGPKISDAGMAHLAGLTKLSHVDLDHQGLVTDAGLAHLRNARLVDLQIRETAITDKGLNHLSASSATLTFLGLAKTGVTDEGVKFVATTFKELRGLNIQNPKITDAGLRHLAELKTLRGLDITGTQLTDAGLEALRKLELEQINVPLTKVTAAGVKKFATALPKCTIYSDHRNFERGADADRRAAEWVLRAGGGVSVHVGDKNVPVPTIQQMPAEKFAVVGIYFGGDKTLANVGALWEQIGDLGSLRILQLHSQPVTDADFEALSRGPCAGRLVELHVWNTQITEAGLALLKRFPNLEVFGFTVPVGTSIPDRCLKQVMADLPKLARLTFGGTAIGDDGLAPLRGRPLIELVLWHNRNLTDAGMEHLAGQSKLEILRLEGTQVGDAGLAKLEGSTEVLVLNLYDTRVTDAGLAHIARFRKLRDLDLGSTSVELGRRITDAGLAKLQDLPDLNDLRLVGLSITDAAIPHLIGFSKLSQLHVTHTKLTADGVKKLRDALPKCLIVSDHGTFEARADVDRRAAEWAQKHGGAVWVFRDGKTLAVAAGAALPEGAFAVERIDLPATARIVDTELAPLAGLPRLHTLVLTDIPIGDVAAQYLAASVGLTDLHLTGTKISDNGLRRLKGLPHLRLLTLAGTAVTDQGVASLGGHATLEDLNVHNTAVGDAAVAELAKCPKLQTLHLSSTRVTDAGLTRLAALKSLRVLTLTNTRVTAAGVKQLALALPNCRIESDHGNFGPADRSNKAIDLLALIDPTRDAYRGKWKRDGGALVSPPEAGVAGRLAVPRAIPDEYELTAVVERPEGTEGIWFGIAVAGRPAVLVVNSFATRISGLMLIDGKPPDANETTHRSTVLTTGQRHTIRVSVGKRSVRATVDGTTIVDWSGDPSRLTFPGYEKPPDKTKFWLGTYGPMRFHRLELGIP